MEISNHIIKWLQQRKVLNNYDTEIYSYGVYLALGNLISFLIIILSGIVNHRVYESIVFLIVFNLIRTKAGGFHLKSGKVCFIISMIYLSIVPYILNELDITIKCLNFLYLSSIVLITLFSPVDTKKRKLSKVAKGKLKIKIIIALCISSAIYVIALILHLNYYLYGIFLASVTSLILLLLGIYDNFRVGKTGEGYHEDSYL